MGTAIAFILTLPIVAAFGILMHLGMLYPPYTTWLMAAICGLASLWLAGVSMENAEKDRKRGRHAPRYVGEGDGSFAAVASLGFGFAAVILVCMAL